MICDRVAEGVQSGLLDVRVGFDAEQRDQFPDSRCPMRPCRSSFLLAELVVLQGRRWARSHGSSMALVARICAALPVEEAIFVVWDLVREVPPLGRDRAYRRRGDFDPVAVALAENAALIARAGGPFSLIADNVDERVRRIDGDAVWDEDLRVEPDGSSEIHARSRDEGRLA